MKGYVYSIKSPSNKRYIGITKRNPKKRFREHIRHSMNGVYRRKFYKAIRHYGEENMKMDILEEVTSTDEYGLMEKLFELENKYIIKFDTFFNGYNGTLGGEGTVGLSGELNPFFGKKHGIDTLERLSKLAKQRKHSDETKRKISESSKGRKHSKESIKLMKEQKAKEVGRSVICLDTKETFRTITDCSNRFNIARSDIRKVCEGKRITAHGMKFRFLKDGKVVEIIEPENKRAKRIKCVQTGKSYESIQACCDDLGVRHQHVSAILRGRQKTTKGYSFIYD